MTETLLGVSPSLLKDPADPPSAEELAAAKELVRQARAQGVALTGPGGLLKALTKTVLETALEEEMAEHLGYDKHDPLGRNRGNSRNGKRAKTVLTSGPIPSSRSTTAAHRSVRSLSAPPAKIILVCCGGLPGSARNAVGPWRTAVTSPADSSGICSQQENALFGCRRS